jgi:hypothetical protein
LERLEGLAKSSVNVSVHPGIAPGSAAPDGSSEESSVLVVDAAVVEVGDVVGVVATVGDGTVVIGVVVVEVCAVVAAVTPVVDVFLVPRVDRLLVP